MLGRAFMLRGNIKQMAEEGTMPSPFPGMDPYLEGYLWPDVHHRLATQISDQLMPMLRPRYVARIEIQVVPDATPEADIGIMYPDVEVVRAYQRDNDLPPVSTSMGVRRGTAHYTDVVIGSLYWMLKCDSPRSKSVILRTTASVTSIEILSPVNKRGAGIEQIFRKTSPAPYRRRAHPGS